jgi:hypothetical protein
MSSTCTLHRHAGEKVTDVAQRLLADHGGLRGLFRFDGAELARVSNAPG